MNIEPSDHTTPESIVSASLGDESSGRVDARQLGAPGDPEVPTPPEGNAAATAGPTEASVAAAIETALRAGPDQWAALFAEFASSQPTLRGALVTFREQGGCGAEANHKLERLVVATWVIYREHLRDCVVTRHALNFAAIVESTETFLGRDFPFDRISRRVIEAFLGHCKGGEFSDDRPRSRAVRFLQLVTRAVGWTVHLQQH